MNVSIDNAPNTKKKLLTASKHRYAHLVALACLLGRNENAAISITNCRVLGRCRHNPPLDSSQGKLA